ncbi:MULTISPECIES: rod shape-determining protein MreC [unclassified Roseateles]|uniref:rod shape-determining protein MreC n=1 Tax=unclassified Roseateles TaxID=2626991 RepID=UPI0006F5C261|nr:MULTISPECIES: rod shape-determining protein MreC [unclassified Roseateles]KQW46622.1 rod shape-determining protein MreC [Pelomonas sp. Root405]KRA73673.1 rod shape-determining protein MreC [Pelomonas sp. Root662]
MPLGTLDRTPPPFFRQGPSALTKLALCSALALFMMVADARFKLMQPVRAGFALVLHPVQRLLLTPVDAWETAGDYLRGTQRAMAAEDQARRQLSAQAERLSRAEALQTENDRLRKLLGLVPSLSVPAIPAEVLFEAPDPFSRRVVLDRGATVGVTAGAPVINEAGVLGQVTRVYPLSAEVTLLTDKEAAIPLLNARTQMRNAAAGRADGAGMELRFLAANSDVKVGDVMTTSGLDGVYPPGLPVAKVSAVERRGDSSFAQVLLAPIAQPDSARHVLVLLPQDRHLSAKREADVAAVAEAASAADTKASARAAKKVERAEKAAAKASGAAP